MTGRYGVLIRIAARSAILVPLLAADALAGQARSPADALLRLCGVKAGLCVHLGCGDGALTAALAANDALLIHGIEADAGRVAEARARLLSAGVYGRVSVERGSYARLPYADNTVNLLVADDLPGVLKAGLSVGEVLRVLAPGGVALLGRRAGAGAALTEEDLAAALSGAGAFRLVRAAGLWARLVKPRPAAMDEWTHRRHGPGGCRVSRDTALGPPGALQWVAGPVVPTGPSFFPDAEYDGMVTAGGRNFYILRDRQLRLAPGERGTFIVARDAFNGLILWRRRVGSPSWNCLVAVGDELLTVDGGKVVALAGDTGLPRRTYDHEAGAPVALLCSRGVVVAVWRDTLRAFDLRTARPKWTRPLGGAVPRVNPEFAASVYLGDGRAFCHVKESGGKHVVAALDLDTGGPIWRKDVTAFVGQGVPGVKMTDKLRFWKGGLLVFESRRQGEVVVHALAARDGRLLWRFSRKYPKDNAGRPYHYKRNSPSSVMVDGLVWVRTPDFASKAGKSIGWGRRTDRWEGLDPAGGEVKRTFVVPQNKPLGCHLDVATERYFVVSRPPNFVDARTGKLHEFRAARHACRASCVLGNGLYYSYPNVCTCVPGQVPGFVAFGSAAGGAATRPAIAVQERGPAFGRPGPRAAAGAGDWPTFRHDARRSGCASASLPAEPALLWTVALDDQKRPGKALAEDWSANPLGAGRITAPVAAGGRVYVALSDSHRVAAVRADDGKRLWTHTTGGRIDAPPTVHAGLCIVGSRDGWVTCLRSSDGRLVWRFRAAPHDRRIVAFGQIESPWPVVGGVLVEKGVAYVAAGRSSEADGGIYAFALDCATGRLRWAKRQGGPGLNDLLVGGDKTIAIGGHNQFRFDPETGLPNSAARGRRIVRDGSLGGSLRGAGRLLDRSWHWSRTGVGRGRFLYQNHGNLKGQLLVFGTGRAFGFRGVAKSKATELVAVAGDRADKTPLWSVKVAEPFQPEAMALAGDVLLVAGPADRRTRAAGLLRALSAKDGKTLYERRLDAPPAPEGIAVANGRLFVTTEDGKCLCWGKAD